MARPCLRPFVQTKKQLGCQLIIEGYRGTPFEAHRPANAVTNRPLDCSDAPLRVPSYRPVSPRIAPYRAVSRRVQSNRVEFAVPDTTTLRDKRYSRDRATQHDRVFIFFFDFSLKRVLPAAFYRSSSFRIDKVPRKGRRIAGTMIRGKERERERRGKAAERGREGKRGKKEHGVGEISIWAIVTAYATVAFAGEIRVGENWRSGRREEIVDQR